jgi:MFS transporter, ACS family, hexuronate transporter
MKNNIGNYRWRIVALLFFATTINYVDRQVLSFVMTDPFFKKQMLGLPDSTVLTSDNLKHFKVNMGLIDSAFKTAYAIGFLLVGWMIDRLGTKKGFSIGIIVWSIAAIFHSFIKSLSGLRFSRIMLGLGESTNFPSAIKTVSEWFPKSERSFATGVFNAGTNIGIIITALTIPAIISHYGWRTAFIATGILGFVLLILWWFFYSRPEENKKISRAEFEYIKQDGIEVQENKKASGKNSWIHLLKYRQTWAFAIGKFLADPIWWFYMTWLPDFFNTNEALDKKLDLGNFGIPFLIIYLFSDLGSMFFGWLATRFMKIGWSENRARKTTMLICALCVLPIYFASVTHSLAVAISLISLATAAHQGWSANMYSFGSNLFPPQSVAGITGFGGMAGAVGGIILAALAGYIIAYFGYRPMFIIASCAYITALSIIHLILPKLQPVVIREQKQKSLQGVANS